MTRKEERTIQKLENVNGGKGVMKKELLLSQEEMGEHCGLFGQVTLEPGAVLGAHVHRCETETYYILSGSGVYMDNGTQIPAKTGDVFFCEDGGEHGMINTGDEELVFIALILKK